MLSSQGDAGPAQSRQSDETAGFERTWDGRRSRRRKHLETLHGTEGALSRSSPSFLCGSDVGGVLVSGIPIPECGALGDDCTDVRLLRGTMCDRWGQMPVGMAAHRFPRAGIPPADKPTSSDRTATVCPTLLSSLDSSQHIIHQRLGLPRVQDAEHGKASKTTTTRRHLQRIRGESQTSLRKGAGRRRRNLQWKRARHR